MRLTLGLLADAANTSKDNKLNILGEFNRVIARDFPAEVPSFALVCRLEADGNEADDHTAHVRLVDQDGNLVRPLVDISFTLGVSSDGLPRRLQFVLPIARARFDAPGTYAFEVLVDDTRPDGLGPIEVHVVHAPAQQPG